jgi:CRP-like cAMP-binding protein
MLAMERIALMGQALAKTRLAGLFVRLNERMGQFDDNWSNCFELHLTQRDMADLIGITTVHLNNVVQDLRAEGIIQLTRSELRILDLDRLLALAALSPWRQARPTWLPA